MRRAPAVRPSAAPRAAQPGRARGAGARWYRDPTLPVPRTEVTRFPHGVLEVKLSLPEGQKAPEWVQDLLDSGYLTEARARGAAPPPRAAKSFHETIYEISVEQKSGGAGCRSAVVARVASRLLRGVGAC